MSKNDKSQKVVTKKGAVVNRKYNRTINQGVAQSAPKWQDMGGGVLKRVGKPAYVKVGPFGKLVSLTARERDFRLAPKEAPEVVNQAAE